MLGRPAIPPPPAPVPSSAAAQRAAPAALPPPAMLCSTGVKVMILWISADGVQRKGRAARPNHSCIQATKLGFQPPACLGTTRPLPAADAEFWRAHAESWVACDGIGMGDGIHVSNGLCVRLFSIDDASVTTPCALARGLLEKTAPCVGNNLGRGMSHELLCTGSDRSLRRNFRDGKPGAP